jgi:hypothetical protein
MAKRERQETYYSRSADVANRKLNFALRSSEKVYEDFEIAEPRETEATYQTLPAPTTNPPKPRAKKLAYSREAMKLVVMFRDGTWWEYNDIPVEIWNNLKSSDSTGKFLKYSGLDQHDDMGPFNPSQMAEETRVLFNS